MEQTYWRKCGNCKKEIGFNTVYQACSVSSCRKLAYCSVNCWSVHNEVLNHKSAWAEENRSPRKEDYKPESDESAPRRIIVGAKPSEAGVSLGSANEEDILIVASKLKQYIKDKHDMNTSANVMEILSKIVRRHTDQAAAKARSEGRKTVMDRDYE